MIIDYLSLAIGAGGMFVLILILFGIAKLKKKKIMLGNLKQKVWEMDEKVRSINEKSREVHNELDELYKIFVEMEKG